jgi:hypothetical protein
MDEPDCTHDWDYFAMTPIGGGREYYRCCLLCEHTDKMEYPEWRYGYEQTYAWPPVEESQPVDAR